MTTPAVVDVAPGYRALRAARNIAVVDGSIVVGLLLWAGIDYLTRRLRCR